MSMTFFRLGLHKSAINVPNKRAGRYEARSALFPLLSKYVMLL